MNTPIRIGTRESKLALWQAESVKDQLETLGYIAELVKIKSTGDLVLDKPLYELGITGIFTKTLDAAMLNGRIDIAVHSMKDVPTLLPEGIVQAAVLERASFKDILVKNGNPDYQNVCTIATGSLRRQAQWLHRYPHHNVVGLRGNVNTRLQKLIDSDWQGAVFAKAGLERIELLPENHEVLDWMIPAPAQGAMMVVALENDSYFLEACAKLNHSDSQICTSVERQFLRELEGGCTAPIGALAELVNKKIHFKGVLLSLDGKDRCLVERTAHIKDSKNFGTFCGEEILENGGAELMRQIKLSS